MMESQLRLVCHYLDNDLAENALFLSSVLHASDTQNQTWAHFKSLSCYRLGQFGLARDYSWEDGLSGNHLGCSYVFALASLQQGNFIDGITALERAQPLWEARKDTRLSLAERFLPDYSTATCLLAKLHRANKDNSNAAEFFTTALETDPFMWNALTGLCDLGVSLHMPNIYDINRIHPEPKFDHPNDVKAVTQTNRVQLGRQQQALPQGTRRGRTRNNLNIQRSDDSVMTDPRNGENNTKTGTSRSRGTTLPKKRQLNGLSRTTLDALGNHNETRGIMRGGTASGSARPNDTQGPRRRSARLQNLGTTNRLPDRSSKDISRRSCQAAHTSRPENKASGSNRMTRPIARGDYRCKEDISPTPASKIYSVYGSVFLSKEELMKREKLAQMLMIFQNLGSAYYHLSRFEPRACLDALASLPIEQQATPWVLSKSARAQYELMDYKESKHTFQVLRKLVPSWLEDLEVYSTVLWHLKEEVMLSLLAHELTEHHYSSPETWCAVGNSFSLERSRDEAIKCFRRACQLSPKLPQAYSLLGYEHMEMEDYHEATAAFRQAIHVDPRFYAAWVGLGRVQEMLDENDLALRYYTTAVQLNSSNAILFTYIARVLERQNNPRRALEYLLRGLKLNPPPLTIALLRMRAANIYLQAGQANAALRELRAVAVIAPDEPRVHLLLGQTYALLDGNDNKAAALKAYTIALSLAPSSEKIKSYMLALDDCTDGDLKMQ